MFTHRDLYNFMREKQLPFNRAVTKVALHNFVLKEYDKESITPEIDDDITRKITCFCAHLVKRWNDANRSEKGFIEMYTSWLDKRIMFPEIRRMSSDGEKNILLRMQ